MKWYEIMLLIFSFLFGAHALLLASHGLITESILRIIVCILFLVLFIYLGN